MRFRLICRDGIPWTMRSCRTPTWFSHRMSGYLGWGTRTHTKRGLCGAGHTRSRPHPSYAELIKTRNGEGRNGARAFAIRTRVSTRTHEQSPTRRAGSPNQPLHVVAEGCTPVSSSHLPAPKTTDRHKTASIRPTLSSYMRVSASHT